jgi:hypothetical protein
LLENANGEEAADDPSYATSQSLEVWYTSEKRLASLEYDTANTINADLVIYVGSSGKDAAAAGELRMAYARGVAIYGLNAKGEEFGLLGE